MQTQTQKVEREVPRTGGGTNGVLGLSGTYFQFCKIKEFWRRMACDTVNVLTTGSMLKVVEMALFRLYVFCQN